MATVGQRGKWAEGQVKKWCSARSDAEATFDFYRYPDARAGSFQVVPADFEAVQQGTPFLFEVKEVQSTSASRRLPQKNFSADKVARMRKRQIAGAECWVIICHMPEKEWRRVPLSVFVVRAPSWDISMYPAYLTVGAVMEQLFGKL